MPTPFSAKNARVQLNGVNMLAMKWTITAKVDELDVSNFEGSGYAAWIGGLLDADISADLIWDALASPFANAPTLLPAALIPNCKFYLDKSSAFSTGFWSFPSLLVGQVTQDTEVRGFVKYSVTFKNGVGSAFLFPG